MKNLLVWFKESYERSKLIHRERELKELRDRIALKIIHDGEVMLVVRNGGQETAIRRFTDKETVGDIKHAAEEVINVAKENTYGKRV